MSYNFKLVLLVRFFGHLIFISGIFSLIYLAGPFIYAEGRYSLDQLLDVKRTVPKVITSDTNDTKDSNIPTSFADLPPIENAIVPISTQYGIVIEKINANAKINPGIDPANEQEYTQALTKGVAEAKGSTRPGEKGNLYLFSHSTDGPWNIVRFNAIFYLLNKLEAGDKILIFYQNRRYDYIVFDKVVAKPTDISFLTNRYDEPILTLQTCDPPGTLFNRLIVRAKLAGG